MGWLDIIFGSKAESKTILEDDQKEEVEVVDETIKEDENMAQDEEDDGEDALIKNQVLLTERIQLLT